VTSTATRDPLTRIGRLAPLTGVAFSVLAAVAFASSQPPPGATANGTRVVAFYQAHSSGQQRSDYCWFLAFTFLLLFAGSLRDHLRRAPAAEALSSLALAGAAALTVGGTLFFGFDYALAVVPGHLDPGAAQALNVLALHLVFPLAAGGCVFGIAIGLAVVRSRLLPSWLGWTAIVIGVVMATPGVLIGIVALILWTASASVLTFRRTTARPPATSPVPVS
jgi:hypothetical protein